MVIVSALAERGLAGGGQIIALPAFEEASLQSQRPLALAVAAKDSISLFSEGRQVQPSREQQCHPVKHRQVNESRVYLFLEQFLPVWHPVEKWQNLCDIVE